MAIPAKAPLNSFSQHGLIARHNVFDVARQEVSVMRQAIGERGAIIENKLRTNGSTAWDLINGAFKRVLLLPPFKYSTFNRRKIAPGGNRWIRLIRLG
jgi:hypothetical protein